MLRKPHRPWIALLTVLLLVWGQLALAAYDCPRESAAMGASGMHWHDKSHDQGSGLCKAHCEQSSHSAQTPTFDLPSVALVALWSLSDPLQIVQGDLVSQAAFQPQISASPPLRIQFQVFRI